MLCMKLLLYFSVLKSEKITSIIFFELLLLCSETGAISWTEQTAGQRGTFGNTGEPLRPAGNLWDQWGLLVKRAEQSRLDKPPEEHRPRAGVALWWTETAVRAGSGHVTTEPTQVTICSCL